MGYGDELYLLGDWARLHFVENNGMAFGLQLGGELGKLLLSLFRLVVAGFMGVLIVQMHRAKAPFGFLFCFALILAGALGNIIDSAFYGLIFSESPYHGGVATLFPSEGGYAGFLHGRVVDMLYFPVKTGIYPEWLPIWGGRPYEFFKPVFNIADVSISVGVFSIFIFYRHYFFQKHENSPETENYNNSTADSTSVSENNESDTPQAQV